MNFLNTNREGEVVIEGAALVSCLYQYPVFLWSVCFPLIFFLSYSVFELSQVPTSTPRVLCCSPAQCSLPHPESCFIGGYYNLPRLSPPEENLRGLSVWKGWPGEFPCIRDLPRPSFCKAVVSLRGKVRSFRWRLSNALTPGTWDLNYDMAPAATDFLYNIICSSSTQMIYLSILSLASFKNSTHF